MRGQEPPFERRVALRLRPDWILSTRLNSFRLIGTSRGGSLLLLGRGTRRWRTPHPSGTGRVANPPRQSRSSSEIATGSLPASAILSITRCESRISSSCSVL